MRTIFGTLGETATAFLALGAALPAADARAAWAFDDASQHALKHALKRTSSDPLPHARITLQAPVPKHSAGRRAPNHCLAPGIAQPNPLGVVVAHYDEDLSWLGERQHNATVYCKGQPGNHQLSNFREWVDLPNIGLESHTYLYHIVSHWNCLDDATLFAQGRADDSVDNYQGIEELFERTLNNPDGMILYRHPGTFNEWWGVWHFGKWKDELDAGTMRKSDRNPHEFWKWMFDGDEPPEKIDWTWSATFAVRRETIRRRPLRFYKRLLNHFEMVNHTKPEEGHFMERFWLSVFKSEAGINTHQLRHLRREARQVVTDPKAALLP